MSLYGFRKFTMDELSQHAGVSKRTVYRYFSSKEQVIEAALDKFMADAADYTDNVITSEQSPEKIVKQIIGHLITQGQFITNPRGLNDLRQYYPHLWHKIDQFRMERINLLIKALIQHSDDSLINRIDPRISTAVITASIQSVLNPDFILKNNLTFKDALEQLSEIFISIFLQNKEL